MWSLEHGGQRIDGVVALDPVFLQYLLQLCGGAMWQTAPWLTARTPPMSFSPSYWKYPDM
ncbi:MAG: hypothetical protein ACLVKA_06325 [Collinsella aerofaciens]